MSARPTRGTQHMAVPRHVDTTKPLQDALAEAARNPALAPDLRSLLRQAADELARASGTAQTRA